MAKTKLEYIWLDGYEPVQSLRSKTKIVSDFGGSLDECMRPHLSKLEREKQQMQMMGLLQPIRSTTADVRQTSSGVGDVGDLYNREI